MSASKKSKAEAEARRAADARSDRERLEAFHQQMRDRLLAKTYPEAIKESMRRGNEQVLRDLRGGR